MHNGTSTCTYVVMKTNLLYKRPYTIHSTTIKLYKLRIRATSSMSTKQHTCKTASPQIDI